MVKISIIVPVYNTEKYLDKCLDSLVSLDYDKKNYEIIIVNDGSKDQSEKIILKYKKKCDNIIYIKKDNGGVSSARNIGLKNASGKYVTFIDSDDYVNNNLLSTFFSLTADEDLFVFGYNDIFNDKIISNNVEKNIVVDIENCINLFFEDKSVRGYTWNKIFKSEIIKKNKLKFHEDISYLEDLTFVVEYLQYCKRVFFCKERLYNYVIRDGSLINSKFNKSKLLSLKGYSIIEKIVSKLKREYLPTIEYFIFELNYELSIRIKISNEYKDYIQEYKMLKKNMKEKYYNFILKNVKVKYKLKATIKYFFYHITLLRHERKK